MLYDFKRNVLLIIWLSLFTVLLLTAGAENGVANGEKAPAVDAVAAAAAGDGIPPTFTEKPRIIPNEMGTLVTMKFRVRAKPKAEMQWYKGNQKIHEDSKFKSKYIELGNDEYEVLLEILVMISSIRSGPYLICINLNKSVISRNNCFIFVHRNQLQRMEGTTNVLLRTI